MSLHPTMDATEEEIAIEEVTVMAAAAVALMDLTLILKAVHMAVVAKAAMEVVMVVVVATVAPTAVVATK